MLVRSFDLGAGSNKNEVSGTLTANGRQGVVVSKAKPNNLTSMYLSVSNGVLAELLLDELKRNSAFDGQEPLRKMVREAACRLQKL